MDKNTINHLFNKHQICVIIPTYNNSKTLKRVIDEVLNITSKIIIVNDGSTDETSNILSNYSNLSVFHFPKNQGKGCALQKGFLEAKKLGFKNAITIDSDGQHYPADIPVFLEALEQENQDILLIGNRNMEQEGVPKKSSFGNKFSNFWFWFETNIKLQDTQSGFRLYPLEKIPTKYFTTKFEFEIEVIVRTAWKNIPVKNVPIQVKYDPAERVSHFRPFKDFSRISVLNTILVIITIFYIKPKQFFNSLKKKSLKSFIKNDILEANQSNKNLAWSMALGLFIGLSPFWGLHTFLTISIAVFFKLNKVLAFTFSNVSLPPFVPFIIYSSLYIGGKLLNKPIPKFSKEIFTTQSITNGAFQYFIGSIVLAFIVSSISGLVFHFILNIFRKNH
jgi:glycosyltransferase involved in cell wall biosynthesis